MIRPAMTFLVFKKKIHERLIELKHVTSFALSLSHAWTKVKLSRVPDPFRCES